MKAGRVAVVGSGIAGLSAAWLWTPRCGRSIRAATCRFIRLYLPELARVPDRRIHAPWLMDAAEQERCGVVIGRDYPAPIVNHASARKVALELYGKVKAGAR